MILDTATVKNNVDLVELAGQYTELRRKTRNEQEGPCPKCGGEDRFTVQDQWFFCRQCHEKRGDAIEFVQWIGAAHSFREAIALLTGNGTMTVPTEKRKPERKQRQYTSKFKADYWAQRVDTAHNALWNDESADPGRNYLLGRGIEPETWQAYQLGYDASMPLPGTDGQMKAPAISIPWFVAGQLVHVRYRFLEKHSYTDKDGKKREENKTGRGPNSGRLFGGHLIQREDAHERTLVICEGELNAVSIYQTAGHTQLDVLSLGSQGQQLTDAMIAAVAPYRTILIWMDERENARNNAAQIPGAMGYFDKQDANDYLQAGTLGEHLSTLRRRAAGNETDLRKLLDDLQHGASKAPWVETDAGTLAVMRDIASELGVQL